MEISDKPERDFTFTKFSSFNTFLIFCVVIALHGGLFYVFWTFEFSGPGEQVSPASIVEFRLLPPERRAINIVPVDPVNNTNIHIQMVMPEFEIEISAAENPMVYQLPSTETKQFDHLFDPRLRKKLQENSKQSLASASKQYDSFNNVHGTTVVAVGDGRCMVTMSGTGTNERGVNWGWSSDACGRTNSEKMMDAVEQDVDARKHPLKEAHQ